jgi:hypothetical protein
MFLSSGSYNNKNSTKCSRIYSRYNIFSNEQILRFNFYVDNTIKDDDKFRYKQPKRLAGTGQGKLFFGFENTSKSSQSTIDDIYISVYLLFKNFIAISVVAVEKKKT